MALNPSGAISLAGPVAGQSIAVELGVSATATISLNDTDVRTLAQVPSGVIVMPTDFWGKSNITIIPTQKAIWGFGAKPPTPNNSNVVSYFNSSGTYVSESASAGTARSRVVAATYGNDKAIFTGGSLAPSPLSANFTNLVSNTGVVASDTPQAPVFNTSGYASTSYGGDKAIMSSTFSTVLVSNTGVLSMVSPAVGLNRSVSAGARYGLGTAIFAFGQTNTTPAVVSNNINYVSTTGVIASDTPGVGTARRQIGAAPYGGDKAIFGFGITPVGFGPVGRVSLTNLVSNTGVVASDTPGVAGVTTADSKTASSYGGDKALFAYGRDGPLNPQGYSNKYSQISNTGVLLNQLSASGGFIERGGAGYSNVA
jgi:hypothetical protein